MTYDRRLADAARAAGIRVESPGVELDQAPVASATLDPATLQRVVDRLVGRLRPARIVLPDEVPATGAIELVVASGRGRPAVPQRSLARRRSSTWAWMWTSPSSTTRTRAARRPAECCTRLPDPTVPSKLAPAQGRVHTTARSPYHPDERTD